MDLPAIVAGMTIAMLGCLPAVDDRPNLIVLVASGLGWEEALDWKPGGARDALVQLRTEGAGLRRFHGNPVGAPGHAELLTGRHCLRNGVSGDDGGEQLLHDWEITLAEVCQTAGYATGFFGWWRHGSNPPQHPVSQGFAEFAGSCRAEWIGQGQRLQRGMGPELEVSDALIEIGAAARAFVEQPREQSFLCWITLPPGEDALGVLNGLAGDLRSRLEAGGLAGQTLTVLVADRPGAYSGAKLFGGAGSLSEGGVRIPGYWHWPGVIEPGTAIHDIAQNVDLFVTLAGVAGGLVPEDRIVDGMDLMPLLRNQRPKRWPNRDLAHAVVSARNPGAARTSFRTTNWLAVRDPGRRRNDMLPPGETWELYDLQADPLQQYEVGEAFPFVLARLKSDFGRWYLEASKFEWKPVPLAVGRPEVAETMLLAEYAESVGPDTLRWHLETAAKVEVRVDWEAADEAAEVCWKLRAGDREYVARRQGDRWTFGELTLPCGLTEVILEGAPAGFAEAGTLRMRDLAL